MKTAGQCYGPHGGAGAGVDHHQEEADQEEVDQEEVEQEKPDDDLKQQ